MRRFLMVFAVCFIATATTRPALSQSTWTLDGNAGISVGDHTATSFGWWVGAYRWLKPTLGLGLDAGRHRWEAETPGLAANLDGPWSSFNSLARGGQELQHLCGSIRVRGQGRESSTATLTLGFGAYRQVMRHFEVPAGSKDPRDGRFRQGFSVGFGIAGTHGIAPGIQFRGDWVDTEPRASAYFTAAVGVHVNR